MTTSDPTPALSVLVVEDEASVRSMLALAIRSAGFRVHLAVDGQDAAEQLAAGLEVDVLLMDVRMPRMGGVELLLHLRAQPAFATLPVIAMSAYSDELQEQEVRAAGANAFLPKPFTVADLRAALETVVGPAAE
ncbi:MAG: hypothetical protein AMXMBFR23_24500 [Chloroflexota bacterium]